ALVDIVEETALRLLALALAEAERAGSRLLYRVGPPFVRALIGQEPHPPLEADDLSAIRAGGLADNAVGGLIVVGSHVAMTTRQLEALVERMSPVELEIDVARVLSDSPEGHLAEVAEKAVAALPYGNVVVRTSRSPVTGADAGDSRAVSRRVSAAVVEVVRRLVAGCPPGFVVAKGGISSWDVASGGLDIGRAVVRGPMLPGIVSLWEPMDRSEE